jgi:hypothetical protein
MSFRIPKVRIGDPVEEPTIHFSLEPMNDSRVALTARDSRDGRKQTIAEIGFHHETGVLMLWTRDVQTAHLCKAMNIEPKQGMRTEFLDKSLT